MVMGVLAMIAEVEADPIKVGRIAEILADAGFEDATDVAMLNDRMVEKILGEEAESLGGVLRRAATAAGPILEGWVTEINRGGRASGGGAGECSLVLGQASSPPVPCPERAPRKLVPAVGPVGAGGEASGPTPSVHRAVRLLRGFTKSTLNNKTPCPAAPPESPYCRRLPILKDCPTGGEDGAPDFRWLRTTQILRWSVEVLSDCVNIGLRGPSGHKDGGQREKECAGLAQSQETKMAEWSLGRIRSRKESYQ